MTWERINIRRLPGDSFIAEARFHARFAVGEICKTPGEAFRSAEAAMEKQLAKLRPITAHEELL